MALDNYSNLKAAVRRWTHRTDLDAVMDDIIDLCESEIYFGEEPLKLRLMEARATASLDTSSRFLALPDDFISVRRLKIDLTNGDYTLQYRTPDQLTYEQVDVTGKPQRFTVTTQLEFDRVPDDDYTAEIQYYKKLGALSSAAPTNTLLTNYPNIYLYGCLSAAFVFASEEDKATYWKGAFQQAIRGANMVDQNSAYGPAPQMIFHGSTP